MHTNSRVQPGSRFGKLIVREIIIGSKRNRLVECDCGVIFAAYSYNLENGTTRRCTACANKDRLGKPNLKNRIDPVQRTINDQWNVFRKCARKHGEEFITKDKWLSLVTSDCVYCQSPPTNIRRAVAHAQDFRYNGVDRIDSSLGYVSGNVQTACWTCNRMKGNLSHEAFLAHIRKIV